jgi:hypothetical protein
VSVLQTKQPQTITLDLRKKTVYQMPRFIQHDTNILEIIIMDNGVDADLNNIGKIVVNYERPDKKVISRLLIKNESNKVEYKLGLEENEFAGLAEIQIQFFSIDNQERISTARFNVLLSPSIGTDKIYENNGELSLLQELFVEVESIKQSAENEDARIENEALRQAAESERITKENERRVAETSRINNEKNRATFETERQSNEELRQQQEIDRQNNTATAINDADLATQYATESAEYAIGKAIHAETQGNYAKEQADRAKLVADENKTVWLNPVANFAAIATTYPNPVYGSKVITMDDQKEYRFTTIWNWTGIYSSNGVTALQAQLADANRQTQTLQHGTSIFASALNSPVEFEIQGRTLTSLGNSNLEGNKYYVLADKKTWIRAEGKEGTLIKGVGKFTKSASLITKADFVGKTSGSVTENGHIAKRTVGGSSQGSTSLLSPSAFTLEFEQSFYNSILTLNGANASLSNTFNGAISQHLFSLNIIEQIERKQGRIPSDTVSGKVQWIKDNVNLFRINWHGWGSSVGGNKASLVRWVNGEWYPKSSTANHTNGTVTKLTVTITPPLLEVDSNGFLHALAYAEPSDGTTPSQLNTDFIELEIELKSTAVLDTRPIITRVATFEGKVAASTVENPHKTGYLYQITLQPPSAFGESSQPVYGEISTLNGISNSGNSVPNNGYMSQRLFSYNLIEEVERNIGRIPKTTVAEKVQWLKDNVESIVCDWFGFGTSVGGNKATLRIWNASSSLWSSDSTSKSHTSSSVSALSTSSSVLSSRIDINGFVHFLAYAEPSDGTTPSTINTDFINLDITLKQGATLHDPMLPLYEVDATDYANILVSWDENAVMSRFPKVQGVQHLNNLAVIAEGENLHPSFYELTTLHANAKANAPYELELNATASGQDSWISLPVINGQTYHIKANNGGNANAVSRIYKGQRTSHSASDMLSNDTLDMGVKFTVDSTYNGIVSIRYTSGGVGKFTFTNPMLTLGNTQKPFVPRNPSYLFAPVKLGQIGTTKDSLFKSDGQWTMVERVKKDVVLDGSLAWKNGADFVGYKSVFTTDFVNIGANALISKFNGMTLKRDLDSSFNLMKASDTFINASTSTVLSISDLDSGFGETYNPNTTEWGSFFNGWQAKTTDGNGKPTAWRSLGDGTDAPTQTLAYVSTNKAPNFTPYKLSYVLANPQTQIVNHLVEGDIVVSGSTQVTVDSGVVVREKVVPALSTATYYINSTSAGGTSKLKNKLSRFLGIYKNGQIDTSWSFDGVNAHGNIKAFTNQTNVDPTAEYTVSYLVLDRYLQTVNALDVKASYAGNLKEVVDSLVEIISDLRTQLSIEQNLSYRLMVAAKANNWVV